MSNSRGVLWGMLVSVAALSAPVAAQRCDVGVLAKPPLKLTADERAVVDIIERFRLASFRSDSTSSAEFSADSAARMAIMSTNYLRIDASGAVSTREDGGRRNENVRYISYEGVYPRVFGDVAIVTYRSHYRMRDGGEQYYRIMRVFHREQQSWKIISGFGFPLCH